jgi:hypothetical protein
MNYLHENQTIELDDVRAAIVRLFGPGHSAVIHDGDACVLLSSVRGSYCAGTVTNEAGCTVATFAIDYVSDETINGKLLRHVLAVHIGPVGHWCRRLAELDAYNEWLQDLIQRYPASDT